MSTHDPRGKTIWEMFCDWLRSPGDTQFSGGQSSSFQAISEMREEPAFFNPLGAEPGATLNVGGENRVVTEVHDTTRRLQDRDFSFVDYFLESSEPEKLRVYPGDSGGFVHIHLFLYEEFPSDPGFIEVVNDTTGVFDITDDTTGETTRYDRVHGVQGPYHASVRIRTTGDTDRKPLQYWDWWRPTDDAPEFVFVELSGRTVQIWRGATV